MAADPSPGAASDAASWAAWPAVHASAEQQPSKSAPDPEVDGAILAQWVEARKFSTTTRLRPGYDQEDVDAFLTAIRDTFLGVREPSLTSVEIRDVQFSITRLPPGYDEGEVDAFLDEAGLRLAELTGSAPGGPKPLPAGSAGETIEPRLDAYGVPVRHRPPTGLTYLLVYACLVCGIASATLATADLVTRLAAYQTYLGLLSGALAMAGGIFFLEMGHKRGAFGGRMVGVGIALGLIGLFILIPDPGPGIVA